MYMIVKEILNIPPADFTEQITSQPLSRFPEERSIINYRLGDKYEV